MNGTPKDIDPASDLREDDDEQALPELEIAEQPPGTLAAGRAGSRARSSTRRPRPASTVWSTPKAPCFMSARPRTSRRVTNYTRPVADDARIARMIAGTVTMEFVTTKTETEALLLEANLINGCARASTCCCATTSRSPLF